jgi:hypothetical protein
MMISNEHIQKFKGLYKNRFGKELSDAEAREKASALVRFLKIVLKPMSKEEFDELARRNPSIPLEPAQ